MNDETNPFGTGGDSAGTITIPVPEEDNGKFYLSPDDYVGELMGIDDKPSKAGNAMLTFSFSIPRDGNNVDLKYYCPITGGGAWKLGPCMDALKIPPGELEVSKVIGRKVILTIEDDGEYNGRKKCTITGVKSLEDGLQSSGGLGNEPDDDDIPF